ncbi:MULTISPECIES: DNA polymerase I [unclassified Synechococcus]|uniref:DNA polymerase I n=1 Tax=unclassified Synechococcus TaxID=2626047 RepID=UPI0021A49633|nr:MULTISPECIES: DNA polymerase I [unclassified Synechococcus]MCT0213849.1 DNA polymerase I [Synechococcus sp. CS-1326]MCT0233425.1 DNA polymerase I [Synechococcus sp. CS-1327]
MKPASTVSSPSSTASGGGQPLLLLVDGHSLAFRSFYAFAKGGEGGLATQAGVPTSVTYGFLKALLENVRGMTPQGVVIAFDTAGPTFRHDADATYKAHRDEAPEHFFTDLANLQEILSEAMDLPLCMAPGYEADDVLGTLANRAADAGWRVRILSGDRDLFQLVDDERDIAVLYMGGGPYARNSGPSMIRREGVIAKLGVSPEEVVDLKALTGDSSDNIPGVKGVGPKTAISLLQAHGDLDGIYSALDQQKGALRTRLETDREKAYHSRMLAEILIDIPLPSEPRLTLGSVNGADLERRLQDLELHSLARQLAAFEKAFSAVSKPKDTELKETGLKETGLKKCELNNTEPNNTEPNSTEPESPEPASAAAASPSPAPGAHSEPPPGRLPALNPEILSTSSQLEALVARLWANTDPAQPVALDTETTALNPFKAELVGLGFCWGEGMADLAYIPIGHQPPAAADLLSAPAAAPGQLPLEAVLTALAPWLASDAHPKALQNAKYDRLILLRHGLSLGGVVMDTLLADYLRDANARHGLEAMAEREFGFVPTAFGELVAKGQSFAAVPIEAAALYCGMDVHLTRRLSTLLARQLAAMGPQLSALLREVELPLEPVLALMEATGIRIDTAYLGELSLELGDQLQRLDQQAKAAAGVEFNLASPKQLGELLFDTLGLDRKKSRKTKTGWSTDAAVLEKLEDDHAVVPLVLEHRTLSKLKSTYVDALPLLVEPETGRVHTDFNQAVTATGRLSSSHPNLQNIPIRTVFSRRIRKAFLPQEGWNLISADYSQIELRILTHLSGEEVLVQAYNDGDDVHALTARLLLDKDVVSPEERRLGKTINFGVIYGMGAQRLARETELSVAQAKDFLSRYKQRYPKVFAFLELQERLALSRGYVETILGRRRPFPFDPGGLGRLLGTDPLAIELEVARRAGMEAQQLRAAANAPIQGSSADIIKLAMVRLHHELAAEGLPARLLLQVHDELVLETAPEATEAVRARVKEVMESAVQLSVPLLVETGVGPNWMEAK